MCVCVLSLCSPALCQVCMPLYIFMSNKGPLRLPACRPWTRAGGGRTEVQSVCIFWFELGGRGAVCREQPGVWKYSTLILSPPLCCFFFFVCLFRCHFHALTSFSWPFYCLPSYLSTVRPPSTSSLSSKTQPEANISLQRIVIETNGHCRTLDVRQSLIWKWCAARCIHVDYIWFYMSVFCVCESMGRQWKIEGESPGNLVINHFDRLGLRVCHLWGFVACPLPICTHIILTHDKW